MKKLLLLIINSLFCLQVSAQHAYTVDQVQDHLFKIRGTNMRTLTFAFAFVMLCFCSSFVHAAVLTYKLSGQITGISELGGDGDSGVRSVFSPGVTYTAVLTYDTDTPLSGSTMYDGIYNNAGSITITYSNGNTYGISNASVRVKNNGIIGPNPTWDSFGLSDSNVSGPHIGDASPVALNFSLSDTIDGSVFTSTDLVPLPSLGEFNVRIMETVFRDSNNTTAYIVAAITKLELQPPNQPPKANAGPNLSLV